MFAKMQQSTDNSTTFRTEASYLEIYNEKVKDLLGPDANGAHGLKVRVDYENEKNNTYATFHTVALNFSCGIEL